MESPENMPPAVDKPQLTRAPGRRWLHLKFDDSTPGLVITPSDGDRFALVKEMVIRGCKISAELDRLDQQIQTLMCELADWIDEHGENIERAYLTFRGEGFQFLVIQWDKPSDSALEDALTDLDIKVAQSVNYDLIRLSVLAMPQATEATIESFLPPTGSLVYRNARRDFAPESCQS